MEEERLKKIAEEAEVKRLEEEEKALQALREIREKADEELNNKYKEAIEYLKVSAEISEARKVNRNMLSVEDIISSRKAFEVNKKSLKSDLKKCTAFVKKIKTGGAWSMKPDDIVRDISTLNLSRYVEEVVAAILEAKLKLTDLPVVIALCKAMHERYQMFLPALMTGLWSVIHGKPTEETGKLRRIYVRLLTELILNGLSTETKPLMKLIAETTGGKDGSFNVTDANIVVAFVKAAGFEILGTRPSSLDKYNMIIEEEILKQEQHHQQEENIDEGDINSSVVVISEEKAAKGKKIIAKMDELLTERAVSVEISNKFLGYCKGAYGFLSKSLVNTDAKLQKMEKRCETDRLLAGSLTEAREKGLQDARKLRESLQKSVEAMSDILDLLMPQLEKNKEEETEGGTGVEVWTKDGGDGDGEDFGPFDDEETRTFYCDVPDFLTTVPPGLIGLSAEEIEKRKAVNLVKFGSTFGVDNDSDVDTATDEVAPSSEAELEAAENEEDKESEDEKEESQEENKDTPHYKLMVLLEQELPECSRREQIDEISEKFCTNHGSSKNSRKRLSQTLFHVPRARLDLLPYFSRMAATLGRVWPDIGAALLVDVEQQFHGQAKFKKNQNIESRLRTARYIGELTKFRMAPPIVSLRCLRRCMDDFTGGNVDVACCLLESCGRYLYRLPHTQGKLNNIMETMMRLSKAKVSNEIFTTIS
jgi:regulator of nonsense transcripts 2